MAITLKPRKAVGTKTNKRIFHNISIRGESMANQKLLDELNKAIAMDLRATIQYMWQHVMVLE